MPKNPAATQQHEPSIAGREADEHWVSSSASSSRETSICPQPKTKTLRHKPLTLKCLPDETEWWDALSAQYPNVNLHKELLKAMDWHRADLVKSPKLYFRNWVERAAGQVEAPRELTYEEARARIRVVV